MKQYERYEMDMSLSFENMNENNVEEVDRDENKRFKIQKYKSIDEKYAQKRNVQIHNKKV